MATSAGWKPPGAVAMRGRAVGRGGLRGLMVGHKNLGGGQVRGGEGGGEEGGGGGSRPNRLFGFSDMVNRYC